MKYPQLVSTRAVSAISDWLVTQLEQLGVDASTVYSRLLLSLLHTPLQINALDLAEISDNKVGNLARNKAIIAKSANGANYRRFSAADTEALKRLAAIDSLLEAVPSDQQLSKIESLVDELSLKLREIEEQNGLEDSVFEIGQSEDNALCNSKLEPTEKKPEVSEDPAKRYFNAFPALSDQSTNDYSRKTTSWPQVKANSYSLGRQPNEPCSSTGSGGSGAGSVAIATKKKTKRRRVTNPTGMTSTLTNQMDGKAANSTVQMQSSKAAGAVGVSGAGRMGRTAAQTKANQKKKPTEMWDTDFDGAWEMGRDLIREFVLKQNNRNRSISECDASARCTTFDAMNMKSGSGVDSENVVVVGGGGGDVPNLGKDCIEKRCTVHLDNDEENLMRVAAAATSALFGKNFDMNMYASNACDSETVSSSSRITDSSLMMLNNDKAVIRSEGYSTPDTLASWNEIEATASRRDLDAMQYMEPPAKGGYAVDTGSDCVDSGCDETNYLAAFEAKFDHNVEALWNDCKPDEPKNDNQLNHSFWCDYDNNNMIDKQTGGQQPTNMLNEFNRSVRFMTVPINGNEKKPFASVAVGAATVAAQPNSLSSNASSAIGGMNLTSTIWTDNPNNNEDDVSFYANARLWEMNQSKSMGQKFNFYSTESAVNMPGGNATMVGAATNFDIGNYETASFSKWSDTELPVLPIQLDAASAQSPQKKHEEKIRKNLFGNSYFCNYQSSASSSSSLASSLSSSTATSSSPSSSHTSTTNSNGPNMAQMENSIAEYSFGQVQNVVKRKVTLVNHSSSSCFKEAEPLSFEAKQELFCMNNARKHHAVDTGEQEDLLTSERVRFRPIKQTYTDGYSFDISNKLDQISYERSKSGLLYHNSEVYREYYVYDEEGNGGSRCEDDTFVAPPEFTLKYCIRQNDKSCQTEDAPPNPYGVSPNLSTLLNVEANRMRSTSSLSSTNSSSSRSHLLYYQNSNDLNSSPQYENEHSYDKLIDMSQDSWCLDENRQCCNNNNNAHALWEHCATCSSDVISMPANRLLKDELSADGDEIMSDLKYLIQSISFQSDWDDDRDTDSMADDDDDGGDGGGGVNGCDDITMAKPKARNASRQLLTDVNKLSEYNDENMDDEHGSDDLSSNHIYSNVSKLISDLLQPEKAQTLVQAISEKCQGRLLNTDENGALDAITKKRNIHDTKDVQSTKNEITCNSSTPSSNSANSSNNNNNGHFGSLWAYNDNSIWRKESTVETDAKQSDDTISSATRLCEQWEHANLQKIWKNLSDSDANANANADKTDSQQQQQQQQNAHSSTMANPKPAHSHTDQTISSTSLNAKCLSPTDNCKSMASVDHSKSDPNTLEKFMNLIKQANAPRQCTGLAGTHAQHHNDQCHNNAAATRFDRKRRHSATSQNYFDQMNCALNNCDAIENIKKLATKTITDYDGVNLLNCDQTKKPTTTTIITCKYWTACDSFCLTSTLAFNNNNNNHNNNNIIGSSNNNNHIVGDGIDGDSENLFNCYHSQMQHPFKYYPDKIMDTLSGNDSIMMQPSTFLKQVAAMVSRPLTR